MKTWTKRVVLALALLVPAAAYAATTMTSGCCPFPCCPWK